MTGSMADKDLRQRIGQIEALLREIEQTADPAIRAKSTQIVQALMDFHGAALERILERVADAGAAGSAIIDALGQDDLVSSALLLYNLHPLSLEARVAQALEKVRPYLHSHGGNVELLEVVDGVVRLQMQGSCHGCPSSAVTLKTAIEEAIYQQAPDVTSLEVEGVVEPPPQPHSDFVPLQEVLHNGHSATDPRGALAGVKS